MEKKETRSVVYDDELKIEAFRLKGIIQPFPNHFHGHYVIGFVEDGKRALSCKNKEYNIEKGDIVLFNPGDNHTCRQSDNGTFDYRGLNISVETMLDLVQEVTKKRELPTFSKNVLFDDEITYHLCSLHKMVMNGISSFGKEENLLLLISLLIQKCGHSFKHSVPECRQEIEKVCEFIKKHYCERIYLDKLCRCSGLSKSTLLRAFTKSKGVTPYRYLEIIRINEAKALLKKGILPAQVAMLTGFSDQSHFANYFNSFIGLTPGSYREIFF